MKILHGERKIRVDVIDLKMRVWHFDTTWEKLLTYHLPFEKIKTISHGKEWFSREFVDNYTWVHEALKYYDFFFLATISITDENGNHYNFIEY